MNRKTLSLPLLVLLILLGCVPFASAHNAPFPASYDPSHLVMDTVLEPETVDPAWANDIASHEIIMNVYETLLFFDRDYRDGPYAAGKADQFVPKLATSWVEQVIQNTSDDGVTWVRRWTFTIRTDVKFHDGTYMTPQTSSIRLNACLFRTEPADQLGCYLSHFWARIGRCLRLLIQSLGTR